MLEYVISATDTLNWEDKILIQFLNNDIHSSEIMYNLYKKKITMVILFSLNVLKKDATITEVRFAWE